MQPGERPRPESNEGSKGTAVPPSGGQYRSEFLASLTIWMLLRLLARRISDAARLWTARSKVAALRLRSHLRRVRRRLPGRLRWRERLLHEGRARPPARATRRALLASTAVAALVAVVYVTYCVATIPFAGGSPAQPAPGALIVQGDDGSVVATRGIFKGDSISADHVPAQLAGAVTAIEDRRFYQHGGIDPRAMLRAAWHDLIGRRLEGGSTITQQLARKLYLTPERTFKRKVQEALIAVWLEARFTKNQILADYLNTAYFGNGAYGADAAAKRYFGKTADQLSLSEAAMLAGLIRAPSALEPDRNFQRASARAATVLDAMVREGDITRQQADTARPRPAVLHVAADTPPGDNYFIDAAAAEVKSVAGANRGDLTVHTTLNSELQQLAESIVAKHLAAAEKTRNVHQAALVAMTPDGAILAMVGGRDYSASQFNRATQARRQPGSLFKLFVYLAALRKGLTPDSVVVDHPVKVGDWEPENYGDRYRGAVTLRTAFAQSLNSVAVQLAEAVGIPTVIETAKQLGVRSDLPDLPSVALGSAEVTLLDMTRAFAAVATNTARVDAYAVREITNGRQTLFSRSGPPTAPADDPRLHAEMGDLLSSVVREGTGRAARLERPTAGKTGTSQDYHDAWFVGFTSDLVVGVWAGNDDNTPMNAVTGGSIPATIWHDFVSRAESVRRPPAKAVAEARAPTGTTPALPQTAADADADSNVLHGTAKVLGSGAIELQGQVIHLSGVDGGDGGSARALRRALRHRQVTCAPTGDGGLYDCRVGDLHLSELVSPSGVERMSDDTATELTGAEHGRDRRERGWHHAQRRFWFFRF